MAARISSFLWVLFLMPPAIAVSQEPQPIDDDLQQPAKQAPPAVATGRLEHPLPKPRSVATGQARWRCHGDTCTATGIAREDDRVEACRQLAREVGVVVAFRVGEASLDPSDLKACNRYTPAHEPGPVVFGDGPTGARPPVETSGLARIDERPVSPPPVARLGPGVRRGAELGIVEVRRVASGEIRPGNPVPVEVRIENTGDTAASVGLHVVDLSRGAARRRYTSEKTIEPGGTASWQLDLVAVGDDPSGQARCGERSARLMSIVEAVGGTGVPGYRSGDAGSGGWVPFRDSNDADNERTVSFRFDCEVTFEE